MDTKKYDVCGRALDFDVRSKSRGKFVDKESFLEVINSDTFKKNLADGLLLGELTHIGREELISYNAPYADNVVLSPNLNNVLKAIEVNGSKVLFGCDLLDTPAGLRTKQLLKSGIKLSVSFSTKARQDSDKFYITEILGLDFTMKPDLDAEVTTTNFSEVTDDTVDLDVCTIVNFNDSDLHYNEDESDEGLNFSLREYLREMEKAPYLTLKRRINEVIRYCKLKKQKVIDQKSRDLRDYIDSFIYKYIMNQLRSDNQYINILLNLRLTPYLTDRKPAIQLQQTFRRLKNISKTQQGTIPKELQKKLNKEFQSVMRQIYEYINGKLAKSGKSLK